VTGEDVRSTPALSTKQWQRWLAALLTLIGVARIVATYDDLSETVDEVAHIGAGMEWLALGRYTHELQHPPLARIAAAAGPYLLGIRSQGEPNMWDEGRRILYADGAYLRNLTAARLGMVPFFLLAAFFTWRIAHYAFGPSVALGAVACFTLLPPILAHFGVATTDGPMLAMFAATVYALMRWLDRPNAATGAMLGGAAALALVTKFSSAPYLAVTSMLLAGSAWWLRMRRHGEPGGVTLGDTQPPESWPWGRALASIAVGALVAFLVAWAVYRFSIGSLRGIPMPLAEIPKGIRAVTEHNQHGHPAYFLGESRARGTWNFFPVVLLLKTPISAVLLASLGLVVVARRVIRFNDCRAFVPIAIGAAVLGVAIPSAINIGVRHVLPIYLAVALSIGVAWEWAWQRLRDRRARVILVAATAALSIGTVTVHPDYLAYFNVLAGPDPSRLVADSDLDWGQDMFRLRREVARHDVDTLKFAYLGTGDLSPIVGVPVKFWDGEGRPNGWIAVSETWYRRGQISVRRGRYVIRPNALTWLDSAATFTRIGKGIRLYRIPPAVSLARPQS
jgi:hypothetical protein